MLIVNADDWGGEPEVTEAIERCFAAGAISSTTAMVFMEDSEAAAGRALAAGRSVGLHLNLTQELSGPAVPGEVVALQARVVRHFAPLRVRRWVPDPRPGVRRDVAAAVAAQLAEFERLYGGPPTHVDSHHHVHVCPDVFLGGAIPSGTRVRQTLSAPPGPGGGGLAGAARRAKHEALARRFRTTAAFWRISDVHPALGGAGLDRVLERAVGEPVEVMVHPDLPEELEVLLSGEWREALAGVPVGGYGTLGSVALAASSSPAP